MVDSGRLRLWLRGWAGVGLGGGRAETIGGGSEWRCNVGVRVCVCMQLGAGSRMERSNSDVEWRGELGMENVDVGRWG